MIEEEDSGFFNCNYGADLLVLKSIDWSKFSASIVSVERYGDNEVMFKQLLAFFNATRERCGWDLMFFK